MTADDREWHWTPWVSNVTMIDFTTLFRGETSRYMRNHGYSSYLDSSDVAGLEKHIQIPRENSGSRDVSTTDSTYDLDPGPYEVRADREDRAEDRPEYLKATS